MRQPNFALLIMNYALKKPMRQPNYALCIMHYALLIIVGVSLDVQAQRLNDLDINVVLHDNGDAHITEVRQMEVTSKGTECNIPIGNLQNGSVVYNLAVTDETGVEYISEKGNWNVERTRAEKRQRCGIHHVDGGYELCWGIGDAGNRTYTTSYIVSNVVRGYQESDGFNFMFVADEMSPLPEHVKLTIAHEDTTRYVFGPVKVWGFRYKGTIEFEDGKIVAETTEPFDESNSMIVVAEFQKGMFHPEKSSNNSFEQVKTRAFEDSDYNKKSSNSSGFFKTLRHNIELVFLCLFTLGSALWVAVITPIKIRNRRRKLLGDEKQLLWYRGVPVNGDLKRSNNIINHLQVKNDYDNLLSAYILRMFYMGLIRFDTVSNEKGNLVKCFRMMSTPMLPVDTDDARNIKQLYQIFCDAAGADSILEPRELRQYMSSHARQLQPWAKQFHQTISFNTIRPDEAQQLFGLKKYLQEFTLSAERNIQEVHLWKDYLIFATLFGNAKQVMDELARLYPDYKNLDRVFAELETDRNSYLLYHSLITNSHTGFQSAYSWTDPSARRSSGGGGWASSGGGGGFSGGGHGGGIR